ncbi:MAG: hypothetical protein FVQ82_12580 [Planctomycetes bacterium]|nr:hypothetical protein [Planctomycetota bacterium]
MLFADVEYEKKILADTVKYSTDEKLYKPQRTKFWHVDCLSSHKFKVSQDCQNPLYYTFVEHFGITEWKIDGGYSIKQLANSAVKGTDGRSIGYDIQISPDSRYMATLLNKEGRYFDERDHWLCVIDLKDNSIVKVLPGDDIGPYWWHSNLGKNRLFVNVTTDDDIADESKPQIFHDYEIANGSLEHKVNREIKNKWFVDTLKWSPDSKKVAVSFWRFDFFDLEDADDEPLDQLAISYDNCKTFKFLKQTDKVSDFCWLNDKEILAEDANDIVKIDITNNRIIPVMTKGYCLRLLAVFNGKPVWQSKSALYVGDRELLKYENKFGSSVKCNSKHIAVKIDSILKIFDQKLNLVRKKDFYNSIYLEGMLAGRPIVYLTPRGGAGIYEYNFLKDKLTKVIFAKDIPLTGN